MPASPSAPPAPVSPLPRQETALAKQMCNTMPDRGDLAGTAHRRFPFPAGKTAPLPAGHSPARVAPEPAGHISRLRLRPRQRKDAPRSRKRKKKLPAMPETRARLRRLRRVRPRRIFPSPAYSSAVARRTRREKPALSMAACRATCPPAPGRAFFSSVRSRSFVPNIPLRKNPFPAGEKRALSAAAGKAPPVRRAPPSPPTGNKLFGRKQEHGSPRVPSAQPCRNARHMRSPSLREKKEKYFPQFFRRVNTKMEKNSFFFFLRENLKKLHYR